jgi:hypothetical protein
LNFSRKPHVLFDRHQSDDANPKDFTRELTEIGSDPNA